MAANNVYELASKVAQATTFDADGNAALRVVDTAGSGASIPAIINAISGANNIEDILVHFFSVDGNGDMALRLNIDATAIT